MQDTQTESLMTADAIEYCRTFYDISNSWRGRRSWGWYLVGDLLPPVAQRHPQPVPQPGTVPHML